jgi:hypothetical protein
LLSLSDVTTHNDVAIGPAKQITGLSVSCGAQLGYRINEVTNASLIVKSSWHGVAS